MLKIFKDKTLLRILLPAILIRVLIMPFFFHPDLKTYYFQSSFLKKGVVNIYDYLIDHRTELPLKEEFVYLPLTYLTIGTYQIIASPFLGKNFNSWLYDASGTYLEQVGTFRYLFLLKLPYLFFDIVIAYLLLQFFKDERNRKRAFTLWLLNPFTIILIYVFANVDVIPVTFVILSLLALRRQRVIKSGVMLAIGAGFKAYPMLFVPYYLLLQKNIKKGLVFLGSVLVPFLAILVPFWSSGFRQSALVSGLTTRIMSYGIDIGFGEMIVPFVVGAAIVFFLAIVGDKKLAPWKYVFIVLLLMFSFMHYHIQWLLWVAPFVVIYLVKNPKHKWPVLILTLVAFAIPFLYSDKFMNFSLFRPISNLFQFLPTPFGAVQRVMNPYQFQSVLHSILAGGSLVLVWKISKNPDMRT